MKKIDLYRNGKYICSSVRYKTCKEFIQKVKKEGFINWQGLRENLTILKHNDILTAHFSRN